MQYKVTLRDNYEIMRRGYCNCETKSQLPFYFFYSEAEAA